MAADEVSTSSPLMPARVLEFDRRRSCIRTGNEESPGAGPSFFYFLCVSPHTLRCGGGQAVRAGFHFLMEVRLGDLREYFIQRISRLLQAGDNEFYVAEHDFDR